MNNKKYYNSNRKNNNYKTQKETERQQQKRGTTIEIFTNDQKHDIKWKRNKYNTPKINNKIDNKKTTWALNHDFFEIGLSKCRLTPKRKTNDWSRQTDRQVGDGLTGTVEEFIYKMICW